MLSAAGTTMIYPQSLDDAYKAKTTANVASNSACVAACQASNGCAGVVYSTSAKSCALFQPKPSNFANLVAGWVFNPVTNVDTGSVQYSRMAMSTLPNAYIKQSVPGVASSDACALAATKAGYTLFGYNSATKVCSYFAPTASTTKALSLVNTPLVPVALAGAFGSDVVSGSNVATSASDCYKLCIPSQNNCFGSVFDSSAKICAFYQAGFDAASTLGWIIPKTLPSSMAKVDHVDLYVTAHEDDHELFMSSAVYESIKNPTTKTVFVYTSGGDAGQTDGWYQAREAGTLASSKTWINMFGIYSPVPTSSTVLLSGHHIQKITIGNTVHYFLRLSEANLDKVINSNKKAAPFDQPKEYYANAAAVKAVLKAIIVAEASKVAKVTASYSDYLIEPEGDHVLHTSTGRITAELLNSDAAFKTCVSQTPFFGYQHWLDAVNEKDPALTAQRVMWLQLGVGILAKYPQRTDYWSEHSVALGRVYMGTPIVRSGACSF
ncbi:Aste57867_3591 [Aphanomyces stellatus]|uniref:Aste57867_3591 protein n=1 Tax=Aphanomyces stellatus TaxID=120398 RepID=A0A485KA07_9STRA|nr:hypothetical protein As57867_003580 [Aphanomyces stellatus]VFT80752.1 Aste57867_3591 [Aphanomyces stellatus]